MMLNCFRNNSRNSDNNNLVAGTLGPRHFIVEGGTEVRSTQSNGRPWSTLSNLIRFRSDQWKKLPRPFRHRTAVSADPFQENVSARRGLDEDANILAGVGVGQSIGLPNRVGRSNPEHHQNEGVSSASRDSTGFSNSIRSTTRIPEFAFDQSTVTEPQPLASDPILSDDFHPHQNVRLSISSSSHVEDYVLRAPDPASSEFCTSAISIKDHLDNFRSEKVLYDTGSPDNFVTQDFLKRCIFPERPMFGEDIRVYRTPGGFLFAPRTYVEIEVKDDRNGMAEFEKVRFNVTESMGEWDFLLGRQFMNAHGFKMTGFSSPECAVLVLTATKSGERTLP
jgi:hypothetical protein